MHHIAAKNCIVQLTGTLQTQKALMQLQCVRQSKLVPDLLLPEGWQPVTLDDTHLFYKVVSELVWINLLLCR